MDTKRLAPNTRRSYATAVDQITEWHHQRGYDAVTPDTLMEWLRDVDYTYPSIRARLAALRHDFHRRGDQSPTDHPRVRAVARELELVDSQRAPTVATPFTYSDMVRVVQLVDPFHAVTVREVRDVALLLVGWWAGLERGELVGLDVDSIHERHHGQWSVDIRTGRAAHHPRERWLQRDPALDAWAYAQEWMRHLPESTGPLFRSVSRWESIGGRLSSEAVADIVKRWALRLGYDPATYSGNSLKYGPSVR